MRALLRAAPMLNSCDLAPIIFLRMGGPEWFEHCGIHETHNRVSALFETRSRHAVFESIPHTIKASSREPVSRFTTVCLFPRITPLLWRRTTHTDIFLWNLFLFPFADHRFLETPSRHAVFESIPHTIKASSREPVSRFTTVLKIAERRSRKSRSP